MKVLSVHDKKAEAYLTPWTARTIADGSRQFEAACKDPQTQFNKFPADFTLVHIGEFDENTGLISGVEKSIIANAAEYVQN